MSLYLSQLILNPRSRNARADLADCHALHRTLLRAFGEAAAGQGARETFGMLHRVETDPRSGVARVLVQSLAEPDWDAVITHAPDYCLALPDGKPNPDCKEIAAKLDALRAGQPLIFRLRANPTKRVTELERGAEDPQGRKRSWTKRVELQTEPEWQDWLARKGEQGGFRVVAARATADAGAADAAQAAFGLRPGRDPREPVPDARATVALKTRGVKQRPGGEHKLTFGAVLFDGRLVVTDADAFRLTLERGLGSGKAYGFGLLSIAPDRASDA